MITLQAIYGFHPIVRTAHIEISYLNYHNIIQPNYIVQIVVLLLSNRQFG